jgi:hypothetical protein
LKSAIRLDTSFREISSCLTVLLMISLQIPLQSHISIKFLPDKCLLHNISFDLLFGLGTNQCGTSVSPLINTLYLEQMRFNAQNVIDFQLFVYVYLNNFLNVQNKWQMIKFDVFHLPLVFPQESAAILFQRMHCGYTIPFYGSSSGHIYNVVGYQKICEFLAKKLSLKRVL